MKVSELISNIGDDNIEIQNLDTCVEAFSMDKKGITKATFGTESTFGLNGFDKLGLIVWMDRDAVKAAMARAQEGE